MGESQVKFKDTRLVSSIDVDLLYRIPVMLREQHYWKFASVVSNVGIPYFRKLECQM